MNLESFTNYTTYNALYTSNERKESQKYENLPSPHLWQRWHMQLAGVEFPSWFWNGHRLKHTDGNCGDKGRRGERQRAINRFVSHVSTCMHLITRQPCSPKKGSSVAWSVRLCLLRDEYGFFTASCMFLQRFQLLQSPPAVWERGA